MKYWVEDILALVALGSFFYVVLLLGAGLGA